MGKRIWAAVAVGIVMMGVAAAVAYDYQAHRSPAAVAKAVIKSKLNDPDSAVFRHHVAAKRGGEGVWCGEVNARNRMGGMVGFTRYVVEVTPDRELAVLDAVYFDEGDDRFRGKWRLMCDGL